MKLSRVEPTVVNLIRDRVLARFPDLATNPLVGVWFTGSNVWTALLGEEAPTGADWDMFCTNYPPSGLEHWQVRNRLLKRLDLNYEVAQRTALKDESIRRPPDVVDHIDFAQLRQHSSYSDDETCGLYWSTDRGEIDIWLEPDVWTALRRYRTESHAHCRAAFSLTDGLVGLPNERAQEPT